MLRDDSTATLFLQFDTACRQSSFPSFDALLENNPELRRRLESDPKLSNALAAYFRALRHVGDQPSAEGAIPVPQIPGYEFHSVLGRGAMGVVYRATQLSVGRPVALKVLSTARLGNPTSVARFRREADVAARLSHPNIVQIYDAGSLDDVPYIVQELVEGTTLARKLDGKPMDCAEAARLLCVIARAIEFAHCGGIVHRDLKPSNVLIGANGGIKIADFGLARLVTGDDLVTRTGEIAGTPQYMSPEQAAGKPDIGPASDVYALGVMLYEMLTGHAPIEGLTEIETLNRVQVDEPVAPRLLRPSVPLDLQTICLKCLEKEPRNRYLSAQALADDIERFLDHRPILARPARLPRRLAKWVRRRPTTAALSAVVALSLIAAASGGWWHSATLREALVESNGLRKIADTNRRETDEARRLAEGRARNLRRQLYPSKILLAHNAARTGEVPRAMALLEECMPKNDRAPLDDFALRYVRGLCREEEWVLNGRQKEVYYAAFSPDGKTVAVAGEDGTVKLWDVETGRDRGTLRGHTSCVNELVYSPDGRQMLTVSCDNTVRLWDVASQRETAVLERGKTPFFAAAVSPSGKRWAAAGENGEIRLWDSQTRHLIAAGQLGPSLRIEQIRFFDEGRLVSNGGPGVNSWTPKNGRLEATRLNVHVDADRGISAIAVSPDRRMLVIAYTIEGMGHVVLLDAQSLKEIGTFSTADKPVRGLDFSPDAQWLAVGDNDRFIRVWDVPSRRLVTTLLGHLDRINSAVFSPDSRRLTSASNDGTARVWNLRHRTGQWALPAPPGTGAIAFTPDDRYLISQHGRIAVVRDARTLNENWRIGECRFMSVGSAVGLTDRASRGLTSLLAIGREFDVLLCNPAASDQIASFRPGDTLLTSVSMAARAPVLATVSEHGRMAVWVIGEEGARGRMGQAAASRPFAPWSQGLNERSCRLFCRSHNSAPTPVVSIVSPDGSRLASVDTGTNNPYLCDLPSWTTAAHSGPVDFPLNERGWPPGHRDVVAGFAFSSDGKLLATASRDRTVRIWELAPPKERAVLLGHSAGVNCVAFSPDGRVLASGGGDGMVRVWDLKTGQELLTLEGHRSEVKSVAFSPDGTVLASLSGQAGEPSEIITWLAPRQ